MSGGQWSLWALVVAARGDGASRGSFRGTSEVSPPSLVRLVVFAFLGDRWSSVPLAMIHEVAWTLRCRVQAPHGDWSRGGDWPDSMGTFLIWHDVPNLALSFRT